MHTERDKFLTEAMGECWHDFVMAKNPDGRDAKGWTCTKCHIYTTYIHSLYCDFSTWDGFGKLWTWAQKQEWFDLFQCCLYYHDYLKHCHRPGDERLDNDKVLHNELIHPDRFANAVYEFLKEEK